MRLVAALTVVGIGFGLVGCGSSSHAAGVPTLQGSHANSTTRGPNLQALHQAAQCIRTHGIPNYADPTIGPGFTIYADQRDLENATSTVVRQAMSACRTEIAAANFDPNQRPHPPAQMVRDGVRAAQCLRAHGLPNWPDPKASDTFDPGHGFQVTDNAFAGAAPAGADPKASPAFQNAIRACRTEAQAESRDSELSNLARGQ
jgi:hypothetical protein